MSSPNWFGAAIGYDDLAVLTEVAMIRLPLRAPEVHRLQRMQMLLDAEAELARAMAAHTHCGRVNFRGSHGAGDLGAETDAFFAALDRYAQLVRDVASEYRRFVTAPSAPLDLLPADAGHAQTVAS